MARPRKDPSAPKTYRQHSPMSPEQIASFKKYQRGFMKETYTQVLVRLRKDVDKPILDLLDEMKENGESITDYVRQLIVKDMVKQQRKQQRLAKKIKEAGDASEEDASEEETE